MAKTPKVELPNMKMATKVKSTRPGADAKRGDSIPNGLRSYVATAINAIRSRSDVYEIIKTLIREDGLFSSAANSMVALASKSGYKVAAYSAEGEMDLQIMAAAYTVIDKLDTLHDYNDGFVDRQGLQSLLSTMLLDVVSSGGCGAELVLDEDLTPCRIVPIGYSTIEWESDGKGGRYPTQDGGDINLNNPNIFVGEHNRNADEAYSVSLLRPGLGQTFNFNEFLEDTHRAVNRTGHSRLISTIDFKAVQEMAPQSIREDAEKMQKFYNDVRTQLETDLADLEPEDALVSYSTVTHTIEDLGGSKADYSSLLTTLGNLLGVSVKTPASVSGLRASGSQALSNAETLIYLKVVESLRPTVEEVLSRAITLAVRLLGFDGYVKFHFNAIDLRPATELEAYQSSRQKRILETLSYGLINDAEACFELGIRPQGFTKALSGTGFYNQKQQDEKKESAERDSSAGRALSPDTPSSSGGDDK